jgi:hypothetical protein
MILVSCHFGWFKQVMANIFELWLQGLGYFLGFYVISRFLLFLYDWDEFLGFFFFMGLG